MHTRRGRRRAPASGLLTAIIAKACAASELVTAITAADGHHRQSMRGVRPTGPHRRRCIRRRRSQHAAAAAEPASAAPARYATTAAASALVATPASAARDAPAVAAAAAVPSAANSASVSASSAATAAASSPVTASSVAASASAAAALLAASFDRAAAAAASAASLAAVGRATAAAASAASAATPSPPAPPPTSPSRATAAAAGLSSHPSAARRAPTARSLASRPPPGGQASTSTRRLESTPSLPSLQRVRSRHPCTSRSVACPLAQSSPARASAPECWSASVVTRMPVDASLRFFPYLSFFLVERGKSGLVVPRVPRQRDEAPGSGRPSVAKCRNIFVSAPAYARRPSRPRTKQGRVTHPGNRAVHTAVPPNRRHGLPFPAVAPPSDTRSPLRTREYQGQGSGEAQ